MKNKVGNTNIYKVSSPEQRQNKWNWSNKQRYDEESMEVKKDLEVGLKKSVPVCLDQSHCKDIFPYLKYFCNWKNLNLDKIEMARTEEWKGME